MKHVVVIGGGVAGLGAAYKIRRAADAGVEVTFTLVEKDPRLGGKLATEIVEEPGVGRYVVDGGSDSFLTDKTPVHRVARLLGIFDEETGTLEENKKTFIVKDGRLVEMPDGIMMFAPTKIMPMATTTLYSWPAKFRMALDLVIPRKRVAPGVRNDESLESFVVRRMGRECLIRLAEPLVGGVNGSDPAEMSLAATYPNLLEMEQQHGSLVRGFLAQRKKVEEMRRKHPAKPGEKRRTFFSSFVPGLQYLTDRMADAAGRDNIRTGVAATSLTRRGEGWSVVLDTGETLECDAVVVACEVWAAEALLRGVDVAVADLLAQIPSSSSATILMAFDEADCPFDKRWHGILSPAVEHRTVTGVSLMSSKWPGRAPAGRVLLRAFVGGARDPEIVKRSDDGLTEIAVSELTELLGIRPGARPIFSRVFRWERGMPQYTMGHLDRVEEIEARTGSIPGLALAGGGYRGVGVPNCLESGEKAVSKILSEWGVELSEDAAPQARAH
ncbi:MAG TPA: protoporphyrinogen oxidase [Coriobacteriia bacterium]